MARAFGRVPFSFHLRSAKTFQLTKTIKNLRKFIANVAKSIAKMKYMCYNEIVIGVLTPKNLYGEVYDDKTNSLQQALEDPCG